jgi:hypothetical protein
MNVRRLYSTARWQKTRAFVIRRDRRCLVEGPNCNGRAETAHHTKPSSQFPEFFFDVRYIVGCCIPCSRHGAVTQSENRNFRMTIAHLEEVIETQGLEIERLVHRLAAYENGPEREHAKPAIH